MADLETTLASFEGLVHATARMWSAQVRREEEDLAQELRVRVWRSVQSWDPAKGATLRSYVFSAVTNKVKDFKRDAAREMRRRSDAGVSFLYIEDFTIFDAAPMTAQERFDGLYNNLTHDEAYEVVERELFVLPASITDQEGRVLVMLAYGYERVEIARRMGVERTEINLLVRSLREKFADWRPAQGTNVSPSVAPVTVAEIALAA